MILGCAVHLFLKIQGDKKRYWSEWIFGPLHIHKNLTRKFASVFLLVVFMMIAQTCGMKRIILSYFSLAVESNGLNFKLICFQLLAPVLSQTF